MGKIRLTESQVNRVITETVSRILSENLFRGNSGTGKPWRNVPGTEMMTGGAFFNPTVSYNGQEVDFHDLEEYLWNAYVALCRKKGIEPDESKFDQMPVKWFTGGIESFIRKK